MSSQLSTASREALLTSDREYLARTLDGLYIAGWRPGHQFTELLALQTLKPLGVGRRALRRALAESEFFPVVDVVKRKRGRPVRLYELPSPEKVAELLKVDDGPGDTLESRDVARGAYKLALHREVVKRRSGFQTSIGWLADRIGVHRRTIRRFNKKLGVKVEQVYERLPLTPEHARALPQTPAERANFAHWLETPDGTRYAPLQGVLAMLRHMRLEVLFVTQCPNRYWLPAG